MAGKPKAEGGRQEGGQVLCGDEIHTLIDALCDAIRRTEADMATDEKWTQSDHDAVIGYKKRLRRYDALFRKLLAWERRLT
jgi:predicted flavoprotein YhiN